MKTAEFTPGPWVVHPGMREIIVPSDHASRPVGGSSNPERDRCDYANPICRLPRELRHRTAVEVQANGDLLASAPDLYAAGKRALDWLASYPGDGALSAYNELRAALAKAEGK